MIKQVEQEQRLCTSDEVVSLKQFTGWGGIPNAFDPDKGDWADEYKELKELLTEDEYRQARRSTLNAHYTPGVVITEIYEALNQLGFKGGKILDPSTGNGRFFSFLPNEWMCELHGVELDAITGRIAQLIHPDATWNIKGFQETEYPKEYFDGVFSNVPFGNYGVNDPLYNKHKWSIHEYFFGKAIDLLKPNGYLAFITSKYLMDKKDNRVRQYIAQRCELVGAVRLPSRAFKAIANTEVTADILLLRKREGEIVPDENWLHLGLTEQSVPVNEYYLENPECLLGNMVFDSAMFGKESDTACINRDEGFDIQSALRAAFQHILRSSNAESASMAVDIEQSEPELEAETPKVLPADPTVKNYTYTLIAGQLYYRNGGEMELQEGLTGNAKRRIAGMVAVKNAMLALLDYQAKHSEDDKLAGFQKSLTDVYDQFINEFGALNSPANDRVFKEDVDRPLVQSLERQEGKHTFVKADIFTKRTLKPEAVPVINNALDALWASLNKRGRVDLEYMTRVSNQTAETLLQELGNRLFFNPKTGVYETAEEYLSGNVKEKLADVIPLVEEHPEWKRNELALRKVLPKALTIGDINFSLGTTWIPTKYKLRFIFDLLRTPLYSQDKVSIEKEPGTTRLIVRGKADGRNGCFTSACEVFGTRRRCAYTLLEDCLNLQVSSVYDTVEEDGKKRQVLNIPATQLARAKQAALQSEFQAWVLNNRDLVKELEDIYNERFNVYVTRSYDGSFLEIPHISDYVQLHPHQKNAVARILFGGNTLLAHEVGAGKTYTMAAAAQMKKQMGLASKSLFVIPNHMLDQWMREYYTIFPTANLLITTKKDFEKSKRQRFIARIATGEYDAVIMTFTQFERIPMSPEYRSRMIEAEIDEIQQAISESSEKSYSVKRLENQRARLETKLELLADEGRKDDVLYFEQLGIDQVFVDEAHYYKNCYIHTKIQNVAGLGGTRAEKSFDMLMKASYMDEHTSCKGLVFATGTPITNSLAEMFVLQRYLQRNELRKAGLSHFDEWAGVFATIENVLEIAPEGTGFRDRSRFSTFNNLPELITMFHQVADIVLVEDLPYIKRPSIVGGKPEIVAVDAGEYVQQYIGELAVRAERVRAGSVDPSDDNMLLITSNGRNVAIDPRLVDENAPVNCNSKIYAACSRITQVYRQYDEQKALQLAFLDTGIQLYPIMRDVLVENGIPAKEIAFIHDANTDAKKGQLFEKCRNGEVRVLFGSTAKMGAGTNVQERLVAIHDIDFPWRPNDLIQRHGRGQRQGNMFDEIHIFQYVTKGTFDSYMLQTLEHKQRGIVQVMTNKSPVRSCADLDETVLNYAQVKALAAGDMRIREKMELDNKIKQLQLERSAHLSTQDRLKQTVESLPARIENTKQRMDGIQKDIASYVKPDPFLIQIGDREFSSRAEAGEALEQALKKVPNGEGYIQVGRYAGLTLDASKSGFALKLSLRGEAAYPVAIGTSALGNITRIENVPESFPKILENTQLDIDALGSELDAAAQAAGKPFEKDAELKALLQQQAELDLEIELALNKGVSLPEYGEEQTVDDLELTIPEYEL